MKTARAALVVLALSAPGCFLVERYDVELLPAEVAELEAASGPLSDATENAWEAALERAWKVDVVDVSSSGGVVTATLSAPLANAAREGARGAVGGAGGGWMGALTGALSAAGAVGVGWITLVIHGRLRKRRAKK